MDKHEKTKGYDWLKKISLQFLPEKDYEKIEKTMLFLKFRKGETILKQGGSPTHIVFLEKGIVKFNYENDSGKNLILTIVHSPKILGGANLFYKDNNLFSIIAVEECEVIMINSSVLFDVMMNNAKFSIMLYQLASEMFKKAVINFVSLAHKQKESRIADILLFLSSEVYHSDEFSTTLSRKELSEFAGCSVENIIITFSKWKNEGILDVSAKKIRILNTDKLKHISKIG